MLYRVSEKPANLEKRQRTDFENLQTARWDVLIKEPTADLFQRIVEDSDNAALNVFLTTRKLFRLKGSPPLLLPEFLAKLREKLLELRYWETNIHELADCVYDSTMAKYSNFPNSSSSDTNSLKATGVDCRNYYRAFLSKILERKAEGRYGTQAEEENDVAKVVQNMVYRNYLFSEKECKRQNPFSIRYTWEVNEQKIIIWYPSYLAANQIRSWLKENFKDVSANIGEEKRRIQSQIDKTFGRSYQISLDKPSVSGTLSVKEEYSPVELNDGLVFTNNLAEAVSKEKVKNIHKLRPAIRKLGGEKVKHLILQIFTDLSEYEYDPGHIANEYGISKATFSRFAGSKWIEKIGNANAVKIPDLWRNTAKILAGSPVFMETVLTSGFACEIKEVITTIESREGKKNNGR
jgi:hypothetical protein